MRILLSIMVFSLLVFPSTASASSFVKAPNNLGLVGYWSFNDGTGLKATDFSGNGNTGTLTNGPSWAGGKHGYGLRFDGTDDYVDTPSVSTYSFGTGDFTIGFWIKTTDTTGNILSRGATGGAGGDWAIVLFSSELYWQNRHGFNNVYNRTATSILDGNWHHVLIKRSGTTNTMYFDTVQQGVSVTDTTDYSPTNILRMGNGANGFFQGSLDDVRIYSRALGANEVTRLYNTGASKLTSATSDAANSLVGHWKLDDRAGIRAIDSSGRGNNGTLTNFALAGATSNWLSGRLAGGLNFDATDDYVVIPDSSTFDLLNFTMSAWIKIPVNATFGRVISQQSGNYWALILSPTQLQVYASLDTVSGVSKGPALNDNQWHMVSLSRDTVNDVMTWWIDGQSVGTEVTSSNTPYTIAANVFISSYGGLSQFFNGTIDDVRIYNKALSAQEIKTLYTSGTSQPVIANASSSTLTAGTSLASGLVGHWTFDGKHLSTTTTTDASGSGNHGTLTNGPVPARGKMGQGLDFDGVNDYVDAGDSATLSPASAVTMATWFRRNASNSKIEFGKGAVSPTASYYLEVYSDGNIYFYVSGNGSTTAYKTVAIAQDTNWHHLVGVYNGTTLTLYLDGVNVGGSTVGTVPGSLFDSTTPFTIGTGGQGGYVHHTTGTMDDVRIYNRALSATEVKQLYYLGK